MEKLAGGFCLVLYMYLHLATKFAGLTRLQLDEVGRERQVQRQGRQRAEALAERSVELAQAMVPLASAFARGGG